MRVVGDGKLELEIGRPAFVSDDGGIPPHAPYHLIAFLPEGRVVMARVTETPDRTLYSLTIDDNRPGVMIVRFWGRPPMDQWVASEIPPWERFTYESDYDKRTQRMGDARLLNHEVFDDESIARLHHG